MLETTTVSICPHNAFSPIKGQNSIFEAHIFYIFLSANACNLDQCRILLVSDELAPKLNVAQMTGHCKKRLKKIVGKSRNPG